MTHTLRISALLNPRISTQSIQGSSLLASTQSTGLRRAPHHLSASPDHQEVQLM
jgi:hypothetical protein